MVSEPYLFFVWFVFFVVNLHPIPHRMPNR
ncbi:MAG: hypothetical protein HW419_2183 [Deltaproteobacteria bacterium]|nr:hypothetical protein [Deltaproteobacteria bacterium]